MRTKKTPGHRPLTLDGPPRHASSRHRGLSRRSVLVFAGWIAYLIGLVMLGFLSFQFWN
jgi:hypothetical protein